MPRRHLSTRQHPPLVPAVRGQPGWSDQCFAEMLNGRGRRPAGAGPAKPRKARTPESDAAHEAYVVRTYKITIGMYRLLLEFQGGRCWGCRRATGRIKRLAVDHNHRTGEVRMLLCSTCNNIVGHFRDNPEALIRLGLALIDPPSRQAWAAPGMRPGWSSDDDDLRDFLSEVAQG